MLSYDRLKEVTLSIHTIILPYYDKLCQVLDIVCWLLHILTCHAKFDSLDAVYFIGLC